MKKIAHDPELGQRLGRRARESIETQFSPRVVGALIRDRLEISRKGAKTQRERKL
jgi:hypothetical protein